MITPTFRKINLEAYRPGRSISKENKKVIKLSANESALGISNKVQKVLFGNVAQNSSDCIPPIDPPVTQRSFLIPK